MVGSLLPTLRGRKRLSGQRTLAPTVHPTCPQAHVTRSPKNATSSCLTSLPCIGAQTRHKAGAFLQHLSAATAASQPGEQGGSGGGGWQLVRQLLGIYLAEAISAGSSPPS